MMCFSIIQVSAEQNSGGGNIGAQYLNVNETLTEGAFLTFSFQLTGYMMQLSYDPAYLQVVNVESCGLFSPYPTQWQVSQTNNTVTAFETLLFGSPVSIMTTVSLAQFTFKTLKPGQTELFLSDWRINDYSRNNLDAPLLYSRVYIGSNGEYIPDITPEPTAEPSIFNVLDKTYIDNVSGLPAQTDLRPSMSWGEQSGISGYIDIVGFNGMLRDAGQAFINGTAESQSIVSYDFYGNPPGSLDNIDGSVAFSQEGNNLTAYLFVVMDWKEPVYCYDEYGSFICGWNKHQNRATFQDTEIIPLQYIDNIPRTVEVTEHNFSLEPKFSIWLPGVGYSKVDINYLDNSYTQRLKVYYVEQTEKGVYFGNASDLNIWDISGRNISKLNNNILIKSNLSIIDYSALDITFSDFYDTQKAAVNITRINYDDIETGLMNPVLILFIGIILICGISGYILIGRLRA
jgi:hypothetical protein